MGVVALREGDDCDLRLVAYCRFRTTDRRTA